MKIGNFVALFSTQDTITDLCSNHGKTKVIYCMSCHNLGVLVT